MREQTICISVHNGIKYLPLAVKSVRENSYHKDCPFVIYSENSDDGTNEWLEENKEKYNLDVYVETGNKVRRGIGGGMNYCADKAKTEFINFLQADIYVSRNWDKYLFECYDEMVGNDRGIVFSNRIQPDIFNDNERPGTVFVPLDLFGAYHHDFNEEYFLDWCDEFSELNGKRIIRKAEGVSGLIKKEDWDYIGGNDDRFAPMYWEDADLFIRMQNEGFKIALTYKSNIYHFASRTSRFPDDDFTKRPKHLEEFEINSMTEFQLKYGKLPDIDEFQFVRPMPIIDGSPNRIDRSKE